MSTLSSGLKLCFHVLKRKLIYPKRTTFFTCPNGTTSRFCSLSLAKHFFDSQSEAVYFIHMPLYQGAHCTGVQKETNSILQIPHSLPWIQRLLVPSPSKRDLMLNRISFTAVLLPGNPVPVISTCFEPFPLYLGMP